MAQESIYNLVPREYVAPEKPPMYRSQHDPEAPLTGSTFGLQGSTRLPGAGRVTRRSGTTFGPPGDNRPSPQNFMRRGEGTKRVEARALPSGEPFQFPDAGERKVAVPRREEKPILGVTSDKNFVTANAVEAILQAPRAVSTEQPNFLQKEDYGRVPAYLSQVKEEIRRENDMIDSYVREQLGMDAGAEGKREEMPEDERQALLDALKTKWGDVNAKYQKISHIVNLDTTGQVRRKEGLENELKQLEADIERLSRPGPVYIES